MNNDRIIFRILSSIEEASKITISGQRIKVFYEDEFGYYKSYCSEEKLKEIFNHLKNEEVLKYISPEFCENNNYTSMHYSIGREKYYTFEKGENFDKYLNLFRTKNKVKNNTFQEKKAIKTKNNREIFPIDLPQDIKWEQVVIEFLSDEEVKIFFFKDKVYKKNYKDMGFQDTRQSRPNMQWDFLKLLAKKNGEIYWKDGEASPNLKKKKQLLTNTLKAYFQKDDDPFYPYYRKEKCYRIKIVLSR